MFDGYKRFRIKRPYCTAPFPLLLVTPVLPHLWRLPSLVTYSWLWDLGTTRLTIPAGYECDGASIPFCFYDVVDPINALLGAFLHDLLYETQCGRRPFGKDSARDWLRDDLTGEAILWLDDGRARADALLRAFWLASGMPEKMAQKGYIGVRVGGEKPWDDEEMVPNTIAYDTMLAAHGNLGEIGALA